MQITPAMVKELRERTGAGMMECKQALVDESGDVEAAIGNLRKKGQAKADSKAGRITAEGAIGLALAADGGSGALVEINSETDFVAKQDEFREFATIVAQRALDERPADVDALLATPVELAIKRPNSGRIACPFLISRSINSGNKAGACWKNCSTVVGDLPPNRTPASASWRSKASSGQPFGVGSYSSHSRSSDSVKPRLSASP